MLQLLTIYYCIFSNFSSQEIDTLVFVPASRDMPMDITLPHHQHDLADEAGLSETRGKAPLDTLVEHSHTKKDEMVTADETVKLNW